MEKVYSWTWIKGNNEPNNTVDALGLSKESNNPSSRFSSASWSGRDGKFYLFGGRLTNSNENLLGDLWRFDPKSKEWVWLKGLTKLNNPGTNTTPSARHSPATWVARDWKNKKVYHYMYGGFGIEKGSKNLLSDFWRYDLETNNWEKISEQSAPGPRSRAAFWEGDDGDLYLFGGLRNSSQVNDFWKFNIGTNTWQKINEDAGINKPGISIEKGKFDSRNQPGARINACTWFYEGRLYLFGGFGFDVNTHQTTPRILNDLWVFDTREEKKWSWIGGSLGSSQNGFYGTLGESSNLNIPGARTNAVSWIGPDDNMYLFGGFGRNNIGKEGGLNDLWCYNPETREWTWVKGSITIDHPGSYGQRNIISEKSVPGARQQSSGFADQVGRIFLFGGWSSEKGRFNDIWQLKIEEVVASDPDNLQNLLEEIETDELKRENSSDNISV